MRMPFCLQLQSPTFSTYNKTPGRRSPHHSVLKQPFEICMQIGILIHLRAMRRDTGCRCLEGDTAKAPRVVGWVKCRLTLWGLAFGGFDCGMCDAWRRDLLDECLGAQRGLGGACAGDIALSPAELARMQRPARCWRCKLWFSGDLTVVVQCTSTSCHALQQVDKATIRTHLLD